MQNCLGNGVDHVQVQLVESLRNEEWTSFGLTVVSPYSHQQVWSKEAKVEPVEHLIPQKAARTSRETFKAHSYTPPHPQRPAVTSDDASASRGRSALWAPRASSPRGISWWQRLAPQLPRCPRLPTLTTGTDRVYTSDGRKARIARPCESKTRRRMVSRGPERDFP